MTPIDTLRRMKLVVQIQVIRAELAQPRQRHGVEVSVVLVPPHALPQTSSGKLSRSSAKAMYLRGAFAPALEGAV